MKLYQERYLVLLLGGGLLCFFCDLTPSVPLFRFLPVCLHFDWLLPLCS